jgi:RNA polymerase sigma-70 factor (ECF subfamily)
MSFDEIYKKYYNELKRFGCQLNISVEKSEDLVQETFLRFYTELKKNVIFDNPRAWLYKVFLNMFRTLINSDQKKLTDSHYNSGVDPQIVDLHTEYIRNEKRRIIMEMLDMMAKNERELLLLYNNGFSYSEMADILDINPNSVGKTLIRSIEKLKKTLKTQYHEMFE